MYGIGQAGRGVGDSGRDTLAGPVVVARGWADGLGLVGSFAAYAQGVDCIDSSHTRVDAGLGRPTGRDSGGSDSAGETVPRIS